MKTAKISELKAHLSAYLSDVRGGDSIVVLDRNTPVAQIVPINSEPNDLLVEVATEKLPKRSSLPKIRILKSFDVVQALREDRNRR